MASRYSGPSNMNDATFAGLLSGLLGSVPVGFPHGSMVPNTRNVSLSTDDNGNAVLKIEVPGYGADNVKVRFVRRHINIDIIDDDGKTIYEYKRGLPSSVDVTSVTASVKNGVLSVTLPRFEEEVVEVDVTDGGSQDRGPDDEEVAVVKEA